MPSAETLPMAEATPAAPQEPQPGLRCRKCGCGHFRVLQTRKRPAGKGIIRRRECRACGHRVTTIEKEPGAA